MSDEMIATIIIGSIGSLFVLIGTLISQGISVIRDNNSRAYDLKIKQLDWEKEYRDQHLFQPVIDYIDAQLELMDYFVWGKLLEPLDNFEEGMFPVYETGKIHNLELKKNAVMARVRTFNNDELTNQFTKFINTKGAFSNALQENDQSKLREINKKAIAYAGDVLNMLLPKVD